MTRVGFIPPGRIGAAVIAAALACVFASHGAIAKPQRIVSLNLCTDQLVLLLADRDRIASLSFLAADPASSTMAGRAAGIPLNRGRAEDVLPYDPDIVLASQAAARTSVAMLRRLDRRVVVLPLGTGFADVAGHVRHVAEVLGEQEKGEALVAAFERRIAALPPRPAGDRPLAVLFQPNGITTGADNLPGAVLRAAGYDNLAERLGVHGVGYISTEAVIAAQPDLLILGRLAVEHPSLAVASLRQPALAHALGSDKVAEIPHHMWACPIPMIAEAVERLATRRTTGAPARRDRP